MKQNNPEDKKDNGIENSCIRASCGRVSFVDSVPLLSLSVCLLLYFAVLSFLNCYWGSFLVRLGAGGIRGWRLAFTRQAALAVFLVCLLFAVGQGRIFRQKRQSFYKGLITGGYMLLISVLSMILSLMDAEDFSSVDTIVFSMLYFVLIGFNEELIFRGITADLMLRFINGKMGKDEESDRAGGTGRRKAVIIAAVLSSLIFSLAHLSNMQYSDPFGVLVQMIGAFLMGMLLTVVYYRTRNIYSVMFLHAVNDIAGAFSVTILRSEQNVSGLISSYGIGELVMLIPYVIVLVVILRRSKREEIAREFLSDQDPVLFE